ncbi:MULTISPECIES: LrgB family protein [Neobacillus]|uniref:LrgB family protein n=1 Tax=Neobacillus rhizophilus TaxID=2833579 RepID=A0A942U187_9BACI|nr:MULTISPECIES: LrgB family protein [Neobacillus]MBS4211028.1 LrgB family protein [Neobacillus rhizophilus]MBU8917423.1 LrgB family protein [Bacillus sp. FJAT-29953]
MEKMIESILLCTAVTVISYLIGLKVFKRYQKPWLNPLYTVTVFIISMISLFHLNMKDYTSGSGVFSLLLGTATVSLAVPLYKHIKLIKKYFLVILWAVLSGTITGVATVVFLTKLLHVNREIMITLIPKSVTAPIALSISQSVGASSSLTLMFVLFSGILSLTIGPSMLKYARIKSGIAKGLALGTSAQAIGAKRAFEWGELEGAMGSIAMITAAIIMSVFAPLILYIY